VPFLYHSLARTHKGHLAVANARSVELQQPSHPPSYTKQIQFKNEMHTESSRSFIHMRTPAQNKYLPVYPLALLQMKLQS
jgi:hypothetical protein